jgi:hypothetical protein
MAADDFFRRWARHDAELRQAPAPEIRRPAPAPDARPPAAAPAKQKFNALPTLDDVAALTPESDYSPFVARGVDQTVQRSALKKLFSDPHFNLMDGLDTYIDDYNKFEPIPPEMLALLNHAQDLLNPLARFEPPLTEKPPLQSSAPDKTPEDKAVQEITDPSDACASKRNPSEPASPSPDQDSVALAPAFPIPPPDPARAQP